MKKEYCENVIYHNDEILRAIDYYPFIKSAIKSFTVPSWETIENFLPEKTSESSRQAVLQRYNVVKQMLQECQEMGINCCDLIEYIGNYPSNYPYPNKKQKDPRLEKLMQEYDIMPTYYSWDDIEGLQINGDDIIRISSTLDRSVQALVELNTKANDVFRYQYPFDEEEFVQTIRRRIVFPQSVYQERGKSFRNECKKMLKKGNRREF